jgi:hypothetical protein
MQSATVNPIFLPEVERNPKPSHYLDLIRTSQDTGQEPWNIWYLFAFRPEMTQTSCPLYARSDARAVAAQSRVARIDCGLHFLC